MSNGIYMVSAQKPTSVTHSVLGRITSEKDLNLVICKSTLVEIYKVTSEGLVFAKQLGLWGVVENLNILRFKNEKKDSILITTSKYDLMILSCETNADGSCDIITKTHGSFKDAVPRNSSINTIVLVDSLNSSSVIVIKCYDGILKTIPVAENKQLNITTIRMEDLNVIDMAFLNGHSTQSIGTLCLDSNGKLSFKCYELDYNSNKDLNNLLWYKELSDNQAFLIPVPEPCNGVIIVCTQSIMYCNKNDEPVVKTPSFLRLGELNNYCLIDETGQRYLLSNTIGSLYIMVIVSEKTSNGYKVTNLQFEHLGDTVIADNLTYVDNGVVFIGSKLGDSQLIELTSKPNEQNSYINTLESYTNLGPILDMLIVDIEKQGQGQLITCSGGQKNGSLRIIRNGIGIHESANVELLGIKAMWPLRISLQNDEYDDHLILSFYGYTKIFSFIGEEFEDIDLPGFDLTTQTLHCSNVNFNQIIQVTTSSIRLLKRSNESSNIKLIFEWKIPHGELISGATSNFSECLLACRNQIHYFLIGDEKFELQTSKVLDHEIACLDLSPQNSKRRSDFCAVGLWSEISARLLDLPSLDLITIEKLTGDIIPRSILIENLESIDYLFVSLGDGSVISFIINKIRSVDNKPTYELSDRRKVVLGTQPTILKRFQTEKPIIKNNIFACSDRPSVISTTNQKLVYSSVNLKQVEYMCQLNAKDYPNSLALLSSGTLRIGTIDSIQKLHIRTVHLNETTRRISYQAETQTFGIITYRMDYMTTEGVLKPVFPSASSQCPNQHLSRPGFPLQQNQQNELAYSSSIPTTSKHSSSNKFNKNDLLASGSFDPVLIHSFLILDQNTFEVMHSIQFHPNEYLVACLSICFDSEPNVPYYVIGCCEAKEDEPEPKSGRIIVLKYFESKLVQVCEKEFKGAPYCLQSFNGKLLAAVSNSLKLIDFKDNQLTQICSYADSVFITQLKCKNDFILLGDLTKSCTVLTYRADNNCFEQVAKDFTPVWLTCIEMIDDDNFLLCDSFQNVIILKKDSGQSNDEERKCLQNYGSMFLGEQINVFRSGSLGMEQQSNELLMNHFSGSILAGTVNGAIILFVQTSGLMFKILNELQNRLGKYLSSAGKISYNKWRDFESDRRIESHKNIIDGDLIETFLELSNSEASNLIKDFKIENSTIGHTNEEYSLNYFKKLVEELSRLH